MIAPVLLEFMRIQHVRHILLTTVVSLFLLSSTAPPAVAVDVYEENGNLICDTVEQLLGNDTDGDGDPDCSDPDDDGDFFTDRYDEQVIGDGARLSTDHDKDGIPDAWDLIPNSAINVQLSFTGHYEDKSTIFCDVDASAADPFFIDFDAFTASIDGGPTHFDLESAASWAEGEQNDPEGTILMPTRQQWEAANPTSVDAFRGPQDL